MSVPSQDFAFSADRLRAIDSLEKWHFWFWGRHQWVMWLTADTPVEPHHVVLDLGCGTGRFFRTIYPLAGVAVGLDLRPEGVHQTKAACPDGLLLQASAAELPLKDTIFDRIFMQDVLEHIADDRAVALTLLKLLKPGGTLLLTVPALPSLWSYRDEAAGHFRRYTKSDLTAVLTQAGFDIRNARYFMCLLLPLVWFTRRFGRHDPTLRDLEEVKIPLLNAFLKLILKLELTLARWIRWPLGSSLVVLASRPELPTDERL